MRIIKKIYIGWDKGKDLFSFASLSKALIKSSLLCIAEPNLSAAYSLCLEINETKGIKKNDKIGENIKNKVIIA